MKNLVFGFLISLTVSGAAHASSVTEVLFWLKPDADVNACRSSIRNMLELPKLKLPLYHTATGYEPYLLAKMWSESAAEVPELIGGLWCVESIDIN